MSSNNGWESPSRSRRSVRGSVDASDSGRLTRAARERPWTTSVAVSSVTSVSRRSATGASPRGIARPWSSSACTTVSRRVRCSITDAAARTAHSNSSVDSSTPAHTRAPGQCSAAESRTTTALRVLRGSSWRTMSWPCLADAAQCTRRMGSPWRYSRVITLSGPGCGWARRDGSLPDSRAMVTPCSVRSSGSGATYSDVRSATSSSSVTTPNGSPTRTVAGPSSWIPRRRGRTVYVTGAPDTGTETSWSRPSRGSTVSRTSTAATALVRPERRVPLRSASVVSGPAPRPGFAASAGPSPMPPVRPPPAVPISWTAGSTGSWVEPARAAPEVRLRAEKAERRRTRRATWAASPSVTSGGSTERLSRTRGLTSHMAREDSSGTMPRNRDSARTSLRPSHVAAARHSTAAARKHHPRTVNLARESTRASGAAAFIGSGGRLRWGRGRRRGSCARCPGRCPHPSDARGAGGGRVRPPRRP